MKFICKPRWITENCFMMDGLGWGVKGATCILAVKGSEGVALVEASNGKSAPHILETVKELASPVKWVLVTHRHTDHAGGVAPLLKALPNTKAAGHPVTLRNLLDPSKINEATKSMWGSIADLMDPVDDEERLVALSDGDTLSLGDVEVEVIHTPGHSSDHYAYYEVEGGVVYLGDAGGLLSCRTGVVIPASFPRSFRFKEYVKSLERIMGYEPRVLVFSHFGAVTGENALKVIEECIETVEEWRRLACELDVGSLADELRRRYLDRFDLFDPGIRSLVFDALASGLVTALQKEKTGRIS